MASQTPNNIAETIAIPCPAIVELLETQLLHDRLHAQINEVTSEDSTSFLPDEPAYQLSTDKRRRATNL